MMKKAMYCTILLSVFLSARALAQDAAIFPKGEISATNNHTGTVWLTELNVADSVIDCNVAQATFAAGAKLDWHIHPLGQILLITDGTGYYQEKGKPARRISTGDVVNIPETVEHWHGATAQSKMVHIAITNYKGDENVVWLKPVSGEDYQAANAAS